MILHDAVIAFFEVELRNEEQMIRDAHRRDEVPPEATIGTAIDSLGQAPMDALFDWFDCDNDPHNDRDAALIVALIDLLRVVAANGVDASLDMLLDEHTAEVEAKNAPTPNRAERHA